MNPKPVVIVFDVNETLSDMTPMAARFEEVGAPGSLAKTWFAALLRDGFALAASGTSEKFAVVGAEMLRDAFRGVALDRGVDEAITHVMSGFGQLELHPDVVGGVRGLSGSGFRLVTLTNGSTGLSDAMFTAAGIRDEFEALLTVEDAPAWKPVRAAYEYAATACGVTPLEMLLVAVHPWDIHGAAKAGLQTAWVNRSGASYPSYFEAPSLIVGGIDELSEILSAQG
ncbi:2-haloacid dehalogenase [Salinibacterium sp. CAN_S4]|uniref:haloacid dehalogenase type II n=1 Tax=Salinibacterium sp. CAN_S4 TaxID=2787727 RepID=UPI0018EF7DD8